MTLLRGATPLFFGRTRPQVKGRHAPLARILPTEENIPRIFLRSILRFGLLPAALLCTSICPAQPDFLVRAAPISKDNVVFGVRAVDAAGHRGLAVFP